MAVAIRLIPRKGRERSESPLRVHNLPLSKPGAQTEWNREGTKPPPRIPGSPAVQGRTVGLRGKNPDRGKDPLPGAREELGSDRVKGFRKPRPARAAPSSVGSSSEMRIPVTGGAGFIGSHLLRNGQTHGSYERLHDRRAVRTVLQRRFRTPSPPTGCQNSVPAVRDREVGALASCRIRSGRCTDTH